MYPQNSFLPSERELAIEFQVSRNTIVAALKNLSSEDLLEISPGRGTRILPTRTHAEPAVIGIIHNLGGQSESREGLRILEGIQDAIQNTGFRHEFMVISADSPLTTDNSQLEEKYQGVIYLETICSSAQILRLHKKGFPIVVANLEEDLDVPGTYVDHAKAAHEAVKLLVGFGHRRIAFLGRKPDISFYGKALSGYILGLNEAGIPQDELLIGTTVMAGDMFQAYSVTKNLLGLPEPPTAIVAARDSFAAGAVEASREAGLIVGRDISIIGYDDVSWVQEDSFLTTFKEPCYELGATAVEMLINRINNNSGTEKLVIESPIIIRKSAGPLL